MDGKGLLSFYFSITTTFQGHFFAAISLVNYIKHIVAETSELLFRECHPGPADSVTCMEGPSRCIIGIIFFYPFLILHLIQLSTYAGKNSTSHVGPGKLPRRGNAGSMKYVLNQVRIKIALKEKTKKDSCGSPNPDSAFRISNQGVLTFNLWSQNSDQRIRFYTDIFSSNPTKDTDSRLHERI